MKYLFWLVTLVVAGVVLMNIHLERISLESSILASEGAGEEKIFRFSFFEEPSEEEFSFLAFGDMMLGRYVRTLMDKNGKDYVFEKIDLEALRADVDLMHANLEGPIFGEGRSGGTAMIFAFNRDIGEFLASHDFDMVSIANNHSLDMGWEGRDETIEVLDESGVGFCGHPTEPSEEYVYYGESETGMSYAFLCMHSALADLDQEAANALISKLDKEVDKVIVSIHWGVEYNHTASEYSQVGPAHGFVDSGADFVIGHHPHVVQNFEVYNGAPIFYSLGNFVFDQYWAKKVQEELAIKVFFDEDGTRIELLPMKSEKSQSRLMTEEERSEWIERFVGYGEYSEEMKEMIRAFEIRIE